MKWSADSLVLWQQLTKWHLLTSGDTPSVRISQCCSLSRVARWHSLRPTPIHSHVQCVVRESAATPRKKCISSVPTTTWLPSRCSITFSRPSAAARTADTGGFARDFPVSKPKIHKFVDVLLGCRPAGRPVAAALRMRSPPLRTPAPSLRAASLPPLDRSFKSPTNSIFNHLDLWKMHFLFKSRPVFFLPIIII